MDGFVMGISVQFVFVFIFSQRQQNEIEICGFVFQVWNSQHLSQGRQNQMLHISCEYSDPKQKWLC